MIFYLYLVQSKVRCLQYRNYCCISNIVTIVVYGSMNVRINYSLIFIYYSFYGRADTDNKLTAKSRWPNEYIMVNEFYGFEKCLIGTFDSSFVCSSRRDIRRLETT